MLEWLEKVGLRLKRSKWVFLTPEVSTYLGHKINKDGLHPTNNKVRAVREFPTPWPSLNEQLANIMHRLRALRETRKWTAHAGISGRAKRNQPKWRSDSNF